MIKRISRPSALTLVLSTLAFMASSPSLVRGQAPQLPQPQGIMFNVEAPNQRLEMIVNTSRILTLDQKIPTAP